MLLSCPRTVFKTSSVVSRRLSRAVSLWSKTRVILATASVSWATLLGNSSRSWVRSR